MAGSTFAVDIRRNLRATDLGWYSPHANAQESLGVNRRYEDLRAFSWEDVEHILEIERDVIAKVETMTFDDGSDEDADSAAVQILETLDLAQDTWSFGGPLYGLDLGVASSVIAVSAARCVPFASCNAGAFGGRHHESCPCVLFYMRPQLLPLLLSCAEKAGAGLSSGCDGSALLYARSVDDMMAFAIACLDAQQQLDAIEVEPEPDLMDDDED